jgi:hypothetical protein
MAHHSGEGAVSSNHQTHSSASKRQIEDQTLHDGKSSLPNMDHRLHESRESDSECAS